MEKARRPSDARYWVRWAHDQGDVVQGSEKPRPMEREDGRSGIVLGPYTDRAEAEARLQGQHDRCLASLVSGKA